MKGIEHSQELCEETIGCICLCDECTPECVKNPNTQGESTEAKEVKKKRDTMKKKGNVITK